MASPIVSREITVDELRALVIERKGHAYAVLDACNQPLVLEKADQLPDRAVCLYGGQAREDYYAIAPYLFAVDSELFNWIVDKLWKKPWWGIILFAPIELNDLRQHLLRFLKVRGPSDESWYFRFYDPRVLPTFLQTSTQTESKDFFGHIEKFVATSRDNKPCLIRQQGDEF